MAKDILKIPKDMLKAPGIFGKSGGADKMLTVVKNFFKKKK